jgi:hypothetical protein
MSTTYVSKWALLAHMDPYGCQGVTSTDNKSFFLCIVRSNHYSYRYFYQENCIPFPASIWVCVSHWISCFISQIFCGHSLPLSPLLQILCNTCHWHDNTRVTPKARKMIIEISITRKQWGLVHRGGYEDCGGVQWLSDCCFSSIMIQMIAWLSVTLR